MSTTFKQHTTTNIVSNGFTFGVYLWSTSGNWTAGVPGDGAAVTTNIVGGGNPSGYDDISSLFLDSLTLTSGFVAVGGASDLSHGATLEIGTAIFGSTTASVYSDTNWAARLRRYTSTGSAAAPRTAASRRPAARPTPRCAA